MSTNTITQTQTQSYALTNQCAEDFKKNDLSPLFVLDKLEDIFSNFKDWNDPVSLNLRDIRNETKEQLHDVFEGSKTIHVQVIHDIVNKSLADLTKILRNFYDGTLIKDPIGDGEWLWESQLMQYYQNNISNISPFTKLPFKPIEHQFAKTLSVFLSACPMEVNPSSPFGNQALSFAYNPCHPEETTNALHVYQMRMFDMIVSQRKSERYSQKLEKKAKRLEMQIEKHNQVSKRIQDGVSDAKQLAVQLEKTLTTQIERNNEIHEQKNKILESRLDVAFQRLEISEEDNKKLEIKANTLKESLQAKESEVASLRSQLAALHNAVSDSGGSSCTIL